MDAEHGPASVKRILVLGGYGGFGARISRRLSDAGHHVIVAGRSLSKAQAFCSKVPGLEPLALNRTDIPAALLLHSPDLLVDASGPFQDMDLAVPRACIAASVHYCDIADSRAFVSAIGGLDAEARSAGVVVISGASSVPALSGAAIAALTSGMERVTAVEMAISASNKAATGPSVTAAILGQVGKPFLLWRHGREETAYGWQETERYDFLVPGLRPLTGRRVALVDVPDVVLVPHRLPGRPAVLFRAGTELRFQNLALWLLSWPVRWGWLRNLSGLRRWLQPLQRLTARLGSDRSAMTVRVFGIAAGRRVARQWTLIAERDDGPEIPALSVPPIAAKILDGREAFGARDAGQALRLDDFEPAFTSLAIAQVTEERILPDPLYRRVMGERFDQLPLAVRQMHEVLRDGGACGEADVAGAANILGGLVARFMGFPVAGHHRIHVAFSEHNGQERWRRTFGKTSFSSVLHEDRGALVERFGPFRFRFDLPNDEGGLEMRMTGWSFWRMPLPLVLAPRSRAREWEEGGRFCFDVPIELPLIGKIVHYRGWLVPLEPMPI